MSNKTIIGDYQIDPVNRRVLLREQTINIRPKTFELLILFLESPQQVIDKKTILETIWNDAQVDEQVIFQSIKELRKAFSELEPIKTFPRKGYAWVATAENSNKTIGPTNQTVNDTRLNKLSEKQRVIFTSLLLLIVMMLSYILFDSAKSNSHFEGSIIVLPIKSQLSDRDHKWVRLGGMDQLIQQIPSSKHYAVMQIDDALEIMKRAKLSIEKYDSEQLNSIFDVSGAALIVEASLNGTPGDYELSYILRQPRRIDRGVIIESEITDSIDQLASIVTSNIGSNALPSLQGYENQLANQLLAKALSKKKSR